jgi:hypothetical protein
MPAPTGPRKPIGLDLEFAAGNFDHLHRAAGVLLPFDARSDQLLDFAVAALEALRRDRPIALTTLFMRRRRTELDRPVGPHERLVLLLGRLRQQFELRDRFRFLPIRRTDAVGAGVAAADHDHILAPGDDLTGNRIARDDLVLLREKFHREMDAGEIASRHRQIAGRFRASGQRDRIERVEKLARRDVDADVRARTKFDALLGHLRHPPIDQVLFHLEIGDAVAEQAADSIGFLEQDDVVSSACELLRARHSGRARSDDGHALAGPHRRRKRHDPAFFPALIDQKMLDRFDADRIVVDIERARRFAGCGANASGEFGKVVGRMQNVERHPPLMTIGEIVPIGNDVVDRASTLTERDAAIHAASALARRLVILEGKGEFTVMPKAPLDRLGRFLDPRELDETGDLSHYATSRAFAACVARASVRFANISPNARLYSCGKTFTNLARSFSQLSRIASATADPV